MILSEEQISTVADHPLDDLLSQFPAKLRHLDESNDAWRGDIANLLSALIGSPAAFNLPSANGTGSLAEKLFRILQSVRGGALKLNQFCALITAVVADAADLDIWTAVISVIDAVNPLTPPPSSIIPTGFGTPVKTSSSRLDDSETRDIIERELFYEIRDCTHRAVPGFFQKHFDVTKWDQSQQQMRRLLLENHDGTKWKDFPTDPWETPVWAWLTGLEEMALTGARCTLHANRTATEFKERKGQMDIFFQKPKQSRGRFEYKHVLVAGEHKRSFDTSDFKACFLQLTRHVRSIFADQPLRRFVHAFTIKATTMELWIYDRSGAYSSGEFDIHSEPEKLACALVAYATMEDNAMGLDLSIETKNRHRYITVGDANGCDTRMPLGRLLVRQRAVVCRGTTCFSAKQGVVKFSWRSDKRQPSEAAHLLRANQAGVEGVATLVGHRDITSIAELRMGLDFSKNTRHHFRSTTSDQSDGYNRGQSSDSSGSGRKRKSAETDDHGSVRRRPGSQRSARKEASDRLKKGADREMRPSLYTKNLDDPFDNRILSCLVISPVGRILGDFNSIPELLKALRGAIRAHRSLYLKANILHRDVSSNNIIITSESEGMLIDLDLAKERNSGPSGARHQTGTKQYMAIEVLRGIDHTYRHDIESFFYVLLWMCARYAWDEKKGFCAEDETAPEESILRRWEIGSFKEIATAKMGSMTVNGLEDIMEEFPKAFCIVEALCLQIRKLLFPHDKDDRMMIGTPSAGPEHLYNAVLSAFDDTISRI